MKHLIILLIFITSNRVIGYEVTPINWSRFSTPPEDSLSVKLKSIVNYSLKYLLNDEIDSLKIGSDGLYDFNTSTVLEYRIRPPAQVVLALGITLSLGIYDPNITGKSLEETKLIVLKLIKSLVNKHDATGAEWGMCWQCALWAAETGFGAWLIWDMIDSTTQENLSNMMIMEANQFDRDPPYCNDCTNDTKAEENAWNALLISTTLGMMPNHVNSPMWGNRLSQWLVSSYARESDLTRDTVVDGRPVKDWITGWNMREEGYVYNHNLIHPNYTSLVFNNLRNSMTFFLANQTIPQAVFWNSDVVYKHLVDYEWASPPFQSPGGTMYRKDVNSVYAQVYYPEGSDKGSRVLDNFLLFDVLANSLQLDREVSTPAILWANSRADFLISLQERSTTGQFYLPSDGFDTPNLEGKVAKFVAFAYLVRYMEKQNGWGKLEKGFPYEIVTPIISRFGGTSTSSDYPNGFNLKGQILGLEPKRYIRVFR